MTTAVDPVCGMSVDAEQAAARVEYQGTIYHFCSEQCRKDFSADPQRYVATNQGGPGAHSDGDD